MRIFLKKLSKGLSKNNFRYLKSRGGRVKRRFFLVNFYFSLVNLPGQVIHCQYDPFRTSFVCLVSFFGGFFSTMLAPAGVRHGTWVLNGQPGVLLVGNRLLLKYIPLGSLIHNIEFRPNNGGRLVRSAGCSGQLVEKNLQQGFCVVKVPSGKLITLSVSCWASLGVISNNSHNIYILRKAGVSRNRGFRPHVRGVAKNPVDHPNGGRTCGGKVFKTPSGKIAKGVKTVFNNKKRFCNFYIKHLK